METYTRRALLKKLGKAVGIGTVVAMNRENIAMALDVTGMSLGRGGFPLLQRVIYWLAEVFWG
jgi:hypothetical protein